jgi:hypothetical protein
MRVFVALLVSAVLLGCRSKESVYSDGQGESRIGVAPATVPMPSDNSAQALYASASQIYRVDVVDLSTGVVRATLDREIVDLLRASIVAGAVRSTLTMSPPPWNVVLHLYVRGRAPFIAHPVGFDNLRLRSDDPENPAVPSIDEGFDLVAAEVDVDFEVSEVLHKLLGPPRKQYLSEEPLDLSFFSGTE